jgi:hypothetical protein
MRKANQSNWPVSATIKCQRNATLIIFGQQLKLVPKRPLPPSGFKLEQMLAIGLINHLYTPSGKLKNTQIIFYWFLSPSVNELLEWIIAFQNSLLLPNPKPGHPIDLATAEQLTAQAASALFNPLPSGQPYAQTQRPSTAMTSQPTLTDTSAAAATDTVDPTIRCSSTVRASSQSLPTAQSSVLESTPSHPRSQQDDLSLGLLMANTQNYLNSFVPGLAAAGAAGMLTSASQLASSEQLLNALGPSTLAALHANAANELFANDSAFASALVAQSSASEAIHDPNIGAGQAAQVSGNFASLTGFNGMMSGPFGHHHASSSADIEFEDGLDVFDNPIEFSALNIV